MMRFVESKEEFNLFLDLSETFVEASESLPSNIFTKLYSLFLFMTFDEIHMKLFFCHLRDYLKKMGESRFVYLVLEPSPEDYMCKQVKKYKAIEFSVYDSEEQFIEALNENSGGEEPDCIMDNSDRILIMSGSKKWCVFADRDSGISVCAFLDKEHHEGFKTVYQNDLFPTVQAAAKYAYTDDILYSRFIGSYSHSDNYVV